MITGSRGPRPLPRRFSSSAAAKEPHLAGTAGLIPLEDAGSTARSKAQRPVPLEMAVGLTTPTSEEQSITAMKALFRGRMMWHDHERDTH